MSELARLLEERAKLNLAIAHATGMGSLSSLFDEEVVPLDVFIEDNKFLGNEFKLSPPQFEVVRHVERIYFDGWDYEVNKIDPLGPPTRVYNEDKDLYLKMGRDMNSYWQDPVRMINFVTLEWGKGSGKDHVGRISALRVAYMLMCLKNPLQYFGKPSNDTIHILNVASNAKQALDAFFKPMKRAVERRGGWFYDRADPTVNAIIFDKNIEAISGHSEVETQEGLNIVLGIADEIDAFKSTEQIRKGGAQPVNSVEGILKMLHTSASTRFGKTFKNLRMSYPRYLGSPIQQLREKAKADVERRGDVSRHYVSGPLATWDVNPSTSKFDYLQDYEDDPVEAAAKYECKPALAINAYFTNELAVRAAFKDKPMPVTIERYKLVNGKFWMPVYKFADDFHAIRGANYAMHGDLAITSDRAGVAMSHVVKYEEIETTVLGEKEEINTFLEQRPVIKCDFVIAFTSDKTTTPPRDIQIRWARQLAIELMQRGFSIQLFTFDKFESMDSMQILEDFHGVETKRISADVSVVPYRTMKDLINEGRFEVPESPLALKEILSLNLLPNGRIDHPLGGSKDLGDALACSTMGAIELGGFESEDQERAYYGDAVFESGTNVTPDLPYGFNSDMIEWGDSTIGTEEGNRRQNPLDGWQ